MSTALSWGNAPTLAPTGDYKLRCSDYIPLGSVGGSQTSDAAVFDFPDPKQNHLPFRVYLFDQRSKPEHLSDEVWESIQERNARLEAEIFTAFGVDVETPQKLMGKDTGKNTLRVLLSTRGGASNNTIGLPNNPAPMGDYFVEIASCQERSKPEGTFMQAWHNLSLRIVADEHYSLIRGLDAGMIVSQGPNTVQLRDPMVGKGFKTEEDYWSAVERSLDQTQRILTAFGLPAAEKTSDADALRVTIPELPQVGARSIKVVRVKQRIDQELGDTFNYVEWPPFPRN